MPRAGAEQMAALIKAYGIDLGTTNSTLAVVEAPADLADLPRADAVEIEQPTTAGAKISAASSGCGGSWSVAPAQLAPSSRANAWLGRSPGRVKA